MAKVDELPQHYFRARCQDQGCKAFLGGMHIPCDGGLVVFVCPKCRKASAFKNQKFGIDAVLVGPLKETQRDFELEQHKAGAASPQRR
jgi:hypothetical protein